MADPATAPRWWEYGARALMYSVESVMRAVDLLLGVLDKCFANPKSSDGRLSDYLTLVGDVPPRLRQRRVDSIL